MANTCEEEAKCPATFMAAMASATKKRRNPPGNPDPDAEVVALSPRTLLATKRYICDVCHKGFQREQNLQLHRRGHNLPWKLKQRSSSEVRKRRVYVCPELTCAHHEPDRALGDLTGIKKHYSRKHGDKKWRCDKCAKRYAVQSDWKAHSKICGTKDLRCACGTIFSRKDSFVTHRAFCDALAHGESYRIDNGVAAMVGNSYSQAQNVSASELRSVSDMHLGNESLLIYNPQLSSGDSSFMSATATALLQRATDMAGSSLSDESLSPLFLKAFSGPSGWVPDAINRYYYYNNNNGVCMDAAEVSSYEAIQSSVQMSSKGRGDLAQFQDKIISSMQRRDGGAEIGERRSGGMTMDFLGLGASGNGSYFDNEFYSYQQMTHGSTPLEKHMWQ